MKTIDVNGSEILVDDDDYSYLVNCYDIKINDHGYVYCSPKKKFRGMGLFSMTLHKILMNPQKSGRSIVVDHKDGNRLNNQKDNLRVCSHRNNMQNRKTHNTYSGEEKSSKYKGVHFNKQSRKWNVLIKHEDGTHEFLGYYTNEDAAANMYNHTAKELFGEFSLLNDVPYMDKNECQLHRSQKDKTSKYRGVSLIDGRWYAQIYHEGKNNRYGHFETEEDAALYYDEKAIEFKGNKAKLNFEGSR